MEHCGDPVEGIEQLKIKPVQSTMATAHQKVEDHEESLKADLNIRNNEALNMSDDVNAQRLSSGPETPRRVRDIHLDGTVDDMQNVDPYLLDEKDLDIQSEVGGVIGPASSNVSVGSWKSLNLQKAKVMKSVVSSVERSDTSRASQLKQHERSPFLSIDVPSGNNSARSFVQRAKAKSAQYGSQRSLLSASTSALTSQPSARSTIPDRTRSARGQGHGLMSSSSLLPPGSVPRRPNHNIRKPFKHDVKHVDLAVPLVNPAGDLTDRTAVATHAINKILHAQKPSRTHYIQGRLLKARLKPLEPVKMTEPTIQQCRGIVSETRKYNQCDSRTLQRWRAIMTGSQVQPLLQEYAREGASTSESIHQTSEASTPDLTMENMQDSDNNMFADKAWMDELNGLMNGNNLRPSTGGADTMLPFASLPNSRSGPAHCGEELAIIQGPDFKVLDERAPSVPVSTWDEDKDDFQVNVNQGANHSDSQQIVDSTKEEPGSDSVISARTEESRRQLSDGSESYDQNSHAGSGSVSKRPHSATYPQELSVPRMSSILRPKTATGSSNKAVRFAEDGTKRNALKTSSGKTGKESRKESRVSKGRSSCRPGSFDSGFDDKTDPGDGSSGDRGVRTFLTQNPVKSMTFGDSTSSDRTVNSSQQEGKSKKANILNDGFQEASNLASSEQTCERRLSSSQKINDCYDSNQSLGNDNICRLISADKSVTASIVYKEIINKDSQPVCVDLKSRPKEMQNLVKKPVVKPSEVHLPEDKTALDENDNESQIGIDSETKSIDPDNRLLQVSGGKMTVPHTHQMLKTALRQQDYDYDKYSRVSNKGLTSSARRAKAYQNLIKRTKKDNLNVNNTLINQARPCVKPLRNGQRPSSASSFSERTSIQSKHGLLNRKARPSSVPPKQITQTAKKQTAKKQISDYDMHMNDVTVQLNIQRDDVNKYEENKSRKLRSKSASKVTFADHDENSLKAHALNSANSSLKKRHDKQSVTFGSSDSSQTHLTRSSTDDGILGADFNLMWEEIPCYDSDEDDDDVEDEGEPSEEEFGLKSMYDELETQFELLKSEMARERRKLSANSWASESQSSHGRESETQVLSKDSKSDDGVYGEEITRNEKETQNVMPIFFTLEHHLEESIASSHSSPSSDLKNEESISGIEGNDSTRDSSVVISSNLYKKTHLYVEIPRPSSPHKERTQSHLSSTLSKAMKCVPVEEAALSHVEFNVENDSRLLNLDTPSNEQTSENQRPGTPSTITLAPFLNNFPNTNNNGREEAMGRKDQSIHGKPISKSSERMNTSVMRKKSENNCDITGSRKVTLSFSSHANSNKSRLSSHPTTKVMPRATEYSNYEDILSAYRHHCMEDSDGEDSERDEEDQRKACVTLAENIKSNKRNSSSLSSACEMSIPLFQRKNLTEDYKEIVQMSQAHTVDSKSGLAVSGHGINVDELEKEKNGINLDMGMQNKAQTDKELGNKVESQGRQEKNQHKGNSTPRNSKLKSLSLEVVAEPKKLSKLSKQNLLSDADMSLLCHLPPLCFQLNARPPSGFFYYFAYDQNMNPDRIATYLNVEQSPPRFWALLFGFKLAFNMKVPGQSDDVDIGGHPNLKYDPNSSMEGCVYQMTLEQLASLDKFMGYPQNCEHVMLPVWISNCHDSHQLGLAQYCVSALTFIALDFCTCQGPVSPNNFSIEQCLKSADIVSAQYKEHLQSFLPSEQILLNAINVA